MMKSRIVFLCTLAAFLSPMSVMAFENTFNITHDTAGMTQCEKWAKDVTTAQTASVNADGKKTDISHTGN